MVAGGEVGLPQAQPTTVVLKLLADFADLLAVDVEGDGAAG